MTMIESGTRQGSLGSSRSYWRGRFPRHGVGNIARDEDQPRRGSLGVAQGSSRTSMVTRRPST